MIFLSKEAATAIAAAAIVEEAGKTLLWVKAINSVRHSSGNHASSSPLLLVQACLTDSLCVVAFILEQSSEMPKAASSPASYQTASIFDSGTGALSKLSSPPLQTPSLPHKISNKSSLTLVEKRHEPNASTYIYVHPKFGALFAHIAAKPNEDEDPRQPELKALDLESSDPFHSPMLSPLRGGFHSRSSSGVSSPSRLRNITSQDDNGDLWLGAEGLVEWQREQQNKESDSRQQHRNRSRCEFGSMEKVKNI